LSIGDMDLQRLKRKGFWGGRSLWYFGRRPICPISVAYRPVRIVLRRFFFLRFWCFFRSCCVVS
jgi:hypothetical protein